MRPKQVGDNKVEVYHEESHTQDAEYTAVLNGEDVWALSEENAVDRGFVGKMSKDNLSKDAFGERQEWDSLPFEVRKAIHHILDVPIEGGEMESHRSVESAKNDLVDVLRSTSEHHFEAVVTDGTYELYVIVEYNHSSDPATASIVSYEEDNGTLTHEISGSVAMHTAQKVVDEAAKIVGSRSYSRDWTFSDKLDERDGRYVWTKTITGTEKVNA